MRRRPQLLWLRACCTPPHPAAVQHFSCLGALLRRSAQPHLQHALLLDLCLANGDARFKPDSRLPQVMELAQDGTKAVGQWLRQQLLAHVQQVAACRNVGVT